MSIGTSARLRARVTLPIVHESELQVVLPRQVIEDNGDPTHV
jgi:hypothetical protein